MRLRSATDTVAEVIFFGGCAFMAGYAVWDWWRNRKS